MLPVRDQRVRVLLAVALLLIIGVAGYQVGVSVWTGRKYNAACQALERYDYFQAGEHLESYLSFHPTDQAALVLAAQTARRRGDFAEAVRKLRLAEKHGAPADAVAMEKLLLRVQAGDLSDAGPLTQVCTERPDGPEAAMILEALIEGSLRAFNPPLAKWGVDLWLTHRPGAFDQAQGLLWHGRVSEFTQDFPQALADYQRAVELDPERLQTRIRLVEALIREEPRQAIPHLEWLRQRRPDDAEVRFQTARLCRNLGQPEEAGRLLDAILAVTPDKVPVLLERGRVAMDLNRSPEAEHWLRHALSLAPEQRDVHIALADCLRQSGRLDEAKRHQDKAQEIETSLNKRLAELMRPEGTKK
jgi:tetratricopeptide (TPR) repeat protein